MKLYVTTAGLALGSDEELALLDTPFPDLGAAFDAGAEPRELVRAEVRDRIPLSAAELRAPVTRPGKIVCVGVNYPCHVEELRGAIPDLELPDRPVFFVVPGSAVAGPNDPIVLPAKWPGQVDYESELAVVISRTAKQVSAADVWDHIAGVTMANDVSARDIQLQAMSGGHEFTLAHAKGLDTFKPTGPAVVTLDEFSFPLDLEICCRVNGETKQCARTASLIHDVPDCIAYVSEFMRLDPGDVVLTGSPAGVGFFRGGDFLRDGDIVEVWGEGIGSLRNPVASEGERT